VNKTVIRVVCVTSALLAGVVALVLQATRVEQGLNQAADSQPNILLILADDLDDRDSSIARMGALDSLVTERGVTLENAFVTQSLCCPSRASMLRGQYPHNTGVTSNAVAEYHDFASSGQEASTFATWIQDAGYRTAYFGKYLNGYGTTRIPDGWDRWFAASARATMQRFNDQGTQVTYDPSRHHFEDLLREEALAWLGKRDRSRPFLAVMATHAPHMPATPAPRHSTLFTDARLPEPPSFNEDDLSDKNEWVRQRPPLSRAEIDGMDLLYRDRLRAMEGVDEMLGAVLSELRREGELSNTYVFFTSDNGYHFGEHRFHQGKETSYEEDISVPMIVRGPGVARGAARRQIVLNQDLGPTFAEIAGARTPDFVDGRSFLPALGDSPPPGSQWRSAFLVNSPNTDTTADWLRSMSNNSAVRTPHYEYIDYATGKSELYDMAKDPYQTHSLMANPPDDALTQLRNQLGQLRDCSGQGCKSAEGP
jgi:N-acetylglucosamine-6-sulfatase